MTISASMVKELREKTSAGMLDCKKALQANEGNFDKAIDWLRTKGLSKAAKKSGRITAEGSVISYIHAGGNIGVLAEINSETDFVSRNPEFQTFCKNIAMHIAAAAPTCVTASEISEEDRDKERSVLKAKALEEGKKEQFLDKILVGQIQKWESEQALLTQKFVMNPDKTVEEVLNEFISKIGENIVIRRFNRYELGEGLEKRSEDFAAEVAKQLEG